MLHTIRRQVRAAFTAHYVQRYNHALHVLQSESHVRATLCLTLDLASDTDNAYAAIDAWERRALLALHTAARLRRGLVRRTTYKALLAAGVRPVEPPVTDPARIAAQLREAVDRAHRTGQPIPDAAFDLLRVPAAEA